MTVFRWGKIWGLEKDWKCMGKNSTQLKIKYRCLEKLACRGGTERKYSQWKVICNLQRGWMRERAQGKCTEESSAWVHVYSSFPPRAHTDTQSRVHRSLCSFLGVLKVAIGFKPEVLPWYFYIYWFHGSSGSCEDSVIQMYKSICCAMHTHWSVSLEISWIS